MDRVRPSDLMDRVHRTAQTSSVNTEDTSRYTASMQQNSFPLRPSLSSSLPPRAPYLPTANDHPGILPPMSAAADDRARRRAFRPAPLPPPAQKQQLSGVAAAVLDAGGRLGRAVGDVFRRLRIDDTFYSGGGAPNRRWRDSGNNGGRPAAAGAPAAASREEATGGGVSGRFARAQGSMNLSATYDSRTHDVESSVVARGDLWRAEASHSSSSNGAGAGGNGANNNLFLVQLGPVLFVRDTTLLFPVHLSKRHLIWYGFERKVRAPIDLLLAVQKKKKNQPKQKYNGCPDLRDGSGLLAERSALGLPRVLVGPQEMVLHVHAMPEPVRLCKV